MQTAKLIDLLGISNPVLLAPMAGVSGGVLAAQISRAGGLGLIGGGYCDPDWIEREMNAAGDTPVGIGFISWALARQPGLLEKVLERRPRAVMLSFGDISPFVPVIHKAGIPVLAQVQTVRDAVSAANAGADVIVAQGGEAGGHGSTRGTLALVPAVVDAVGTVPVVAAGGIADGRGLAAALILGASAVLCGTAFYVARESLASDAVKEAAITSTGDDTERSSVFDMARGLVWPDQWALRALRNDFHERWRDTPYAIGERERKRYADASAAGDTSTAAVIVGEGVDLVRGIEPAAAILARMVSQFDKLHSAKIAAGF